MKWIKSITAFILAILLVFVLNQVTTNSSDVTTDDDNNTIVDNVIFPHDEVVDVNIEIDEDAYNQMLANAMSEEVVMANITYNGKTFNNVGIRPKGNSSLRNVFQSDSDRYSLKIDFNYYVDDQSFYGITKLNLNNLFSDPSMMAEYLGYEMFDSLDEVSSRTTYVNLSINGEVFGLYLAVEQVNDEFLIDNYSNDSGNLYKPEMGTGADLAYVSDDGDDYTGLIAENKDEYDNDDIAKLIKAINDGEDLDSIFDVDSFLKYLAVSTMTIHQDSYQGGMFHNYYLYDNDGTFEWIPWDLNMIFNGFPGVSMTDEQAIQYLIDEPVSGSMESYPLIEAIFKNEEYVEKYHEYLEILSQGYLASDNFNEKVLSVYKMIKSYVKADPTSFFTYEEFENGLFQDDGTAIGIISFTEQRVENVAKQLSGEIPSTNNGEGNVGSSKGGGMKGQMAGGMETQMSDEMKEQLLTEMEGKTSDEIIEIFLEQMGDQVPDNMKEIITKKFEGKTAEEIIELITNGMDGEVAEGDTQRTPPDAVDGQVAEGDTQKTPPDTADGEVAEGDTQRIPPNGMGGQAPGKNMQVDEVQQQTKDEDETSQVSNTDIIIILALSGLLIASSIFLYRKH